MKTKLNECQKAIFTLINQKIISESCKSNMKIILNEAAGIKSPNDIKDFVEKHDAQIKKTASKMNGKQKSLFIKAYDFVIYACKKGLKFISEHWLDIVKLIGILFLGMFSYRLYCLAMPQIEKLFTMGRQGEIKAAQNANIALNNDGEALQQAVNNISNVIDNPNVKDKTLDKSQKTMKQRMIDKTIHDYKVAPQGKDLKDELNTIAKEIKKDPITARKRASGAGDLAMIK